MRPGIAWAAVVTLALGAVAGCGDPNEFLDGSLSAQYDLSFDYTQARQFLRSESVSIEYVRGDSSSPEKPIIATIRIVPEGPGTFSMEENLVNIGASLLPGEPELPTVTEAEVELREFSPDVEGSTVEGSIHAQFTNAGTGDRFSLEGKFDTTLILTQ